MAIYLDNAATAPMRPEAIAAYVEQAGQAGNASSVHSAGQDARFVVESARAEVAASLGADPAEVLFTGGGTESINIAVKGLFWAAQSASRGAEPARGVVVAPESEHHATLEAIEWLAGSQGAEAAWISVDRWGRIVLAELAALLAARGGEIALVTMLLANNEVGTIQPVAEAARLCAAAGVPVHVDAVSAYGQIPIDFARLGASALSVSAHKIGGPAGVGALLVGRSTTLVPLVHGGGQERRVHSGTVNAPGVAAFGAAARAARLEGRAEAERLRGLQRRLLDGIASAVPDAVVTGDPGEDRDTPGRLPGNVHIVLPGCEGDSLVFLLDRAGIQASNGSACTAGVAQPSHVLTAMGFGEQDARSGLRFTLGRDTTAADVDAVLSALPEVYAAARRAGMAARAPLRY